MDSFGSRSRWLAIALLGSLAGTCVTEARGADHGRVSGTVRDVHGNPLMGATVLPTGPVLRSSAAIDPTAERVITDAHGRIKVDRLVSGLEPLEVTPATRLPALRHR